MQHSHSPGSDNFTRNIVQFWVNMQFSGLNQIQSQLTAYTGQSVHAVS